MLNLKMQIKRCIYIFVYIIIRILINLIFYFVAEEMLQTKDYFRNGQLDKEGLVNFIKDVKKNTKLSDEDAAVLAASK